MPVASTYTYSSTARVSIEDAGGRHVGVDREHWHRLPVDLVRRIEAAVKAESTLDVSDDEAVAIVKLAKATRVAGRPEGRGKWGF